MKSKLHTLATIFTTFFKIGAITFGGGITMLPILRHYLAKKLQWVSEEKIIDYFALSQSTPGIIAVNMSIFVGYERAGVLGAVVAAFGVTGPSIIVILILAHFMEPFLQMQWVKKALKGIYIAVATLISHTVFSLAKKTVFDWLTAIIAIGAAVLIIVFDVQGPWIVIGSALIGFFFMPKKYESK